MMTTTPMEQRKAKKKDKALDWLRQNGPGYDGTIDASSKSAGTKANDMARALDWLRNKNPNALDDLDGPFTGIAGFGGKSKEQQEADAMNKALGWLRQNGADFGDDDAPDLGFNKFDSINMAPKSDKVKTRDMQKALVG